MIAPSASVNQLGHLTFGGYDTVELAKKYGTPLYVLDEEHIRANCRTYLTAMRQGFDERALPLYASKALCCKRLFEILAREGMGADVVSKGELYIAKRAGFPMDKVFFHGNSKPDDELEYALENGVGYFVVDNFSELARLSRFAQKAGVTQKILLRLTPGIDAHTHKAIATGLVDSKFGIAIQTGEAETFLKTALETPNVRVAGLHCHIGSQIFTNQPFIDAAQMMLSFIAEMKDKLGYEPELLNLGGGYGVRYVERDPVIDIPSSILSLGEYVKETCAKLGLSLPRMIMEPGRSIVAAAGLTLYTVNNVKTIPGFKNYVAIDGGMTDNPRYALYGATYEIRVANRANAPADFTCSIAGRCCESGDMIQENVLIPKPEPGETLAVFVTGAYNHSMASNYNCLLRPPIVMLSKNGDYLAVRRETLEDLVAREV